MPSAGAGALPLAVGNSLSPVFARARDGVDLSALEDACLTEIQRLAEEEARELQG